MERFVNFDHIPKPEDEHYISYLSQKVWQMAISQPQKTRLMEVGWESASPFISRTLEKMCELETAAEKPLLDRITEADAGMNAIWCPAAPGTWLKPWKEDRYKNIPYTKWWDRTQMLESLKISQKLGCSIMYNGRPDENTALRKVIEDSGYRSKILKEKLYFIDTNMEDKFNLLEEVRNLRLPERNLQPGDNIGIVVRPGQAIRILHFLNETKNGFPEGVRVKIFPVKTGIEGIPHHWIQETCGLLYYRFTTGDAAENPYPYIV